MTTRTTCTLNPIDLMPGREKNRENCSATKGPSMLAQARSPFDRTPASSSDRAAPLIVGFDGSTSAIAAVTWAATSGAPIIVVRVLQPRPAGVSRNRTELDDASRVFGGHMRSASRRLEGCAWRPEVVEASSPSAGLAAAARRHGALAIVVGSHGRRHHSGVVGSEPHQLLTEADVPVVVIPPQAGARLLHAPLEAVHG
jgi:nucleotide-binding universal stress UspA family protein